MYAVGKINTIAFKSLCYIENKQTVKDSFTWEYNIRYFQDKLDKDPYGTYNSEFIHETSYYYTGYET